MTRYTDPLKSEWWRPLCEESAHVSTVLGAVARDVSHPGAGTLYGPSLLRGSAGAALFLFYLSCSRNDARLKDLSHERIVHAMKNVSRLQTWDLFNGRVGVLWAAAHLNQNGVLVKTAVDVDDQLMMLVTRRPWRGHYDLVSGLVGYGIYALERCGDSFGRMLLERVIDRLAELATPDENGISWFTERHLLPERQLRRYPDGYYNLGLAHGIPGVIALLARACAMGVSRDKARRLLDGAVSWILAQKRRRSTGSHYSYCTSPTTKRHVPSSSRLAWCYGDLGVSMALYCAALSVANRAWVHEALATARRAALRPINETGVKDGALCHGAAGVAHIFNRLYQFTGESIFREAALAWFGTVFTFEDGSRTTVFRSDGVRPMNIADVLLFHGPDLIGGAVGIGLALIGATSCVEPAWDRCLMISSRP